MITLDVARFVAAVGVIWIHVCQSPATISWGVLGRFAVPFFAAAAGYLLVGSLSKPSPVSVVDFLKSRFYRLYLPFACWSLIYVIAGLAKAQMTGESPPPPTWEILYVGGAYHLWFIPYLILASMVGFAACRFVGHQPGRGAIAAGCAYLLGMLVALTIDQLPVVDTSLHYMAMTTPALLWGAALGWLRIARDPRNVRGDYKVVISLSTMVFVGALLLIPIDARSAMLENATGAALLLTALFVHKEINFSGTNRGFVMLGRLGNVSLGIYFSHLLFVKLGEVVFAKFSLAANAMGTLLLMVFSTTAAIVVSLIATRFKATRWLVS